LTFSLRLLPPLLLLMMMIGDIVAPIFLQIITKQLFHSKLLNAGLDVCRRRSLAMTCKFFLPEIGKNRVSGLGEFSPIERLFTVVRSLKINEEAHLFAVSSLA
jgi:hypothetical protein